MQVLAYSDWLANIQQQAKALRHRYIIVLEGEADWAMSFFNEIDANAFNADTTAKADKTGWRVFGDLLAVNSVIPANQYQHYLGTECQHFVYANSQLNLNALAALSGTIGAGGFLYLVLTPEIKNKQSTHYLYQWFIDKLLQDQTTSVIKQAGESRLYQGIKDYVPDLAMAPLGFCRTQGQVDAVAAITKVVTGHRNRPLVLTADRGRGKSSALAIACAQLMLASDTPLHIVITAPHISSLQIFFRQLHDCLPYAELELGQLINDMHIVEFVPVDQLLRQTYKINLLLVDEAAAIPVYLLKDLLSRYHRMVFSSTLHGYEGAGRGFELKFKQHIIEQYKNANLLHIDEPIRWAPLDPVEKTMFALCLFEAQLPPPVAIDTPIADDDYQLKQFTPAQLLADEETFAAIFSLLVTAHYQTKPSDIEIILSNTNVVVSTLWYQNALVAVSLLIKEGDVSQQLVSDVKKSKRRLKDQFLPQSLLTHCGIKMAFELSYLRIMRIAVHPSLQGQGIGSYYLSQLTQLAIDLDADFIGTSFGVNNALLAFWQQQDYQVARVGFTQDKASGEYSAMLLKPLTSKAMALFEQINHQLYAHLNYLLPEVYQQLAPAIVASIFSCAKPSYLPVLTDDDKQTVNDFVEGERQYLSCVHSLHLYLLHLLSGVKHDQSVYPVISKIMQKQSAAVLCANYGFTGQKQINRYLIEYFSKHRLA